MLKEYVSLHGHRKGLLWGYGEVGKTCPPGSIPTSATVARMFRYGFINLIPPNQRASRWLSHQNHET